MTPHPGILTAMVAVLSAPAAAGVVNYGVRGVVSNGPSGVDVLTDFGSGPGTYAVSVSGTSVTSASGSLNWQSSSVSYAGVAIGGTGASAPWAETSFLAVCTVSVASQVSITWNMTDLVGANNIVSWSIGDGSTDLFAVAFLAGPGSGTFVGVDSATASGTFTSTSALAPGSYIIGMAGTANEGGGSLSLSVSFAPVPAPGAMAVLVLGWRARRARRT